MTSRKLDLTEYSPDTSKLSFSPRLVRIPETFSEKTYFKPIRWLYKPLTSITHNIV